MVGRPGFFDVEERLRELSVKGDDLERMAALVDFAIFRAELGRAAPRSDSAKGGKPAFDHVLMFEILGCTRFLWTPTCSERNRNDDVQHEEDRASPVTYARCRRAVRDRGRYPFRLAIGARLELGRYRYHVVGTARGLVASGRDPLIFMQLRDSQDLRFRLAPAAARRWKHLAALTDQEQSNLLTLSMVNRARVQLGMFTVVLLFVSAVIIALIIDTMTMAKLRAIATLTLIAAPDRTIIGHVLQQALGG